MVGNLMLFFVIATTAASPEISEYLKPNSGRRDVNFTLETIFEINQNDPADVRALENAKMLINSVKKTILQNTVRQQANNSETEIDSNATFADFCQKVIAVLYRYKDSDLQEFVTTASDELKNYHYKGCKFHELAENPKLKKYFDYLPQIIEHKPAGDIRSILNVVGNMLRDKNSQMYKRGFIDTFNDLYKADSVMKFKKFLTNIEDYRLRARRNMDIVKIIRTGIRSIIFDHYSDLSDLKRSQFASKLNDFLNYNMGMSRTVTNMYTENKLMRYKTIKGIVTERRWKPHRTRRPTLHEILKQRYTEKDASYDYNRKDTKMKQKYDSKKQSKHQIQKARGFKTTQRNLEAQFSNVDIEMHDSESANIRKQPVIEVVTMRPYVSKRVMTSQKLRYEIHFKTHDFELKRPKLHLKKPEFQIKLPGSHAGRHKVHISRPNEQMNAPIFRYNKLMYLNGKLSTDDESKQKQHRETTKIAVEKLVRSSQEDKGPSNQRFLLSNRKSFENTSVLTRLNYLENELRIAKTQIKNDSEIIRDLNNVIRINSKTGLKTNNNDFLTSGDDDDKIYNKEKKDDMIDLKINAKDLKKLINLKTNEILKNNNPAKDDNVDNDKVEKTIIRKFDFDETKYNKRSRDNIDSKYREKKFSSSVNQSNFKYSTKSQKGYLSDGDTYERVEERIYDSDANKRKPNASEKDEVEKQSNYNDATKSTEKRTVIDTGDRERTNKFNEWQYDSYLTSTKDGENKIGKSDQYTLSSFVKLRLDEAKPSVSIKNAYDDAEHTTEVMKSKYYYNRENDNLSNEYNVIKTTDASADLAVEKYEKGNVEGNQLKFNKTYTIYDSEPHRYKTDVKRNNGDSSEKTINQKRLHITQGDENTATEDTIKQFEDDITESKVVTQKENKNRIFEELEKQIETETVNFVQTVSSEVKLHPRKPKPERVNLMTAVNKVSPRISNRRKAGSKKTTF